MNKAPKLSHVVRLDSIPLSQTYFTPEGYLHDRPILTTTGIFEYINPDGSVRRELRLPDEVFAPESLETYKGKPVIITHDAGLITADNVAEEQIGTILSDGYRSGNDVRAEIIIHDTEGMKECGLKELSLGYNLDLDETPGEWEGQPYDAIQRNIRINHLALVREARAGETARLNIDSRDSKMLKGGKASMSKKVKKTVAPRADGVLSQEELAKAIEEYKARRANRMAAKADNEGVTEEVPAVVEPETAAVDNGEVAEPGSVEEQVQLVKDRRDRRDSEGDPETVEEASAVIANQDEDIDILFDIIDTLLAEKAFDEAAPEEEGTENTDGEEETPAEGEETATDEGEEDDETAAENADEGEDVPAEEGEDVAADEGEEGEEDVAEDEDDEEVPADNGTMNADSVDRIVRTRIQLGMLGRTLNMDGLETIGIMAAKKKIIRAVRPGIRLDGKSATYINAAFDCAVAEIKQRSKKDTAYQKKQMFNGDGRSTKKAAPKSSAASARERMIARHQ